MKKLFNYLSSLFNKSDKDILDNDYDDNFRIRVIELKGGLRKYYPEYRLGMMNSWEQIVNINNKGFKTLFISDSELIASTAAYCDTEDIAKEYINAYKQYLTTSRECELKKEELIKL